jgi:polar amino acid transport system substrate-binding protein
MSIVSGIGFAKTNTYDQIQASKFLKWGADAEGGAPYIFQDPKNLNEMIGFEVDLAAAIAQELDVIPQQIQNGWESLIPALNRNDFDIAMNGLEITAERQGSVLFSVPYYIYTEQIVVQASEKNIFKFADLKGKKVGTLGGAVSQQMLKELGNVDIRTYTGQAEPYEDLVLGRLDAVFMDLPIAVYYAKSNPKLKFLGEPLGEGSYGIVMRSGDVELKTQIDRVIGKLFRNGKLQQIYEKWGIWNASQKNIAKYLREDGVEIFEQGKSTDFLEYIPLLLKGALVTIGISFASMALAVSLGLVITLMRLYGSVFVRRLAGWYIEIYRGTPLLIQLYILYYGLPNLGISFSPAVAAVLGLGMNYAAYESELYRSGIAAVPKGQMEGALSLGMSRGLALRRVILPQALKIALPGITNDFIALFKDSSLVSVIAMVELTKTYNMLASSSLKFFSLGLLVAFIYLAMSLPLSWLARRLENKLQ